MKLRTKISSNIRQEAMLEAAKPEVRRSCQRKGKRWKCGGCERWRSEVEAGGRE